MKHILKCQQCGEYTLKESCPKCSIKAITSRPPRFSPDDKYGDYRRKVKMPLLKEKGIL